MDLTFRSLSEIEPSHAMRAVFKAGWPGWQAWLRGRKRADAPSLAEARDALAEHMPEMLPIWERIVVETGADEEAATFLTFWAPPRFLGGCSQAALGGAEPVLIRNYDLDPRLSEATVLLTRHDGRAVMGMVDGIVGLADGVNDAGLAVSLAYGGGGAVGRGFGVPMVVRYLLQTCSTVAEAFAVLCRLPHHMNYNLTLVDAGGETATVFIGPDRDATRAPLPLATNHQETVFDAAHAAFSRSVERRDFLRGIVGGEPTTDDLRAAFLAAPLATEEYAKGFGTVYTAEYDPRGETLSVHWPGEAVWHLRIDDFREEERRVTFGVVPAAGEVDWLDYVPADLRALVKSWVATPG